MITRAITSLATATVLFLGAACTDVTTEPESTVSGTNIFNDPGSYRAFLAKLYGGLAVTGQQGPAGQGDIGGIDEGFSQYVRGYWQLQELPTDEVVIGWGDESLPEMNTMEWSSSNRFITAFYYRVFYQVALANEFLRETTDEKLASRGTSAALTADIQQYRAEARLLRALSYWHGLDLFGNIPFITESNRVGTEPPNQATRQEIFDFVESEINAVRSALPAAGMAEYGRFDRGVADMILAKLYLNAEVYTGTARYNDALTAINNVIGSNAYSLDDNYMDMFRADNHTSPELIYAVPFDGLSTRTYGGTTFLAHAAVGGSMDAAAYGLNGGWWGLRITPQLVAKFPNPPSGPDRRAAIFYTTGQSLAITNLGNFNDGYAAPKYQNITSTGAVGSNTEFPDTDFPLFRLADAYLMYAEAVLRGGTGGTRAQALAYVNALRTRAYGDASGNITDPQLTLAFLLDERARELYMEGHRRTDLIRYGQFTGGTYLWAFKGGVAAGTSTSPHLNLYPIPAADLLANPRLTQNTDY